MVTDPAALVAELATLRMEELAPPRADEMLAMALEAEELAPARAELAVDSAPDATELTASVAEAAALSKMVLEPMVEVMTESPDVMVVTTGTVEMALPAAPAPPPTTPPTPKRVVEPIVEVMTESPEVMVVKRASVVTALADSTTVEATLVTRVVSVVVAAPLAADEAAELTTEAADETMEEATEETDPALAQYCSPKAMAVAASAALQTALEQSRIPKRKFSLPQRHPMSTGEHPSS